MSVIVVENTGGKNKEVHTIGISKEGLETEPLIQKGRECKRWRKLEKPTNLDLYGEERRILENESVTTERMISNIDNILLNETELVLAREFDHSWRRFIYKVR